MTTEKTTGILSAFWQAISELAADRPAVYDSFRQGILQSRGFRQRELVDGVAELSTAGVKVDNILRDLPAGEYVLELCPLDDHGRPVCGNHLQRIHYNWEPTKPNPYPATSAAPGMYALYDYSENPGSANVPRNYAEVLVSEAAKYEFRSKQFSEVEQATRAWDLNDATAPALRRAYLFSLSRQ